MSKEIAELVSRATSWLLPSVPTSCDLSLRMATSADTRRILDLHLRKFTPRGQRLCRVENEDVYHSPNGCRTPVGTLQKMVADGSDGLLGYALLEIRSWGEVYIFEMAASRCRVHSKSIGVGTVLLGLVAKIALELGKEDVTANVVRRTAVSGRGGSAAMLRHCLGHGFEAAGQRGVLYGGRLAEPDDLWLRARPEQIFASRPMQMLRSRFSWC